MDSFVTYFCLVYLLGVVVSYFLFRLDWYLSFGNEDWTWGTRAWIMKISLLSLFAVVFGLIFLCFGIVIFLGDKIGDRFKSKIDVVREFFDGDSKRPAKW